MPIIKRTALVKSLRTSDYWEAQQRSIPYAIRVSRSLKLRDLRVMGTITKEYFEMMLEHIWKSHMEVVDGALLEASEGDELLEMLFSEMSGDSFDSQAFSRLFKSVSGAIRNTTGNSDLSITNDDGESVTMLRCLKEDFVRDTTKGTLKYDMLDDDDRRYVDLLVVESIRAMAYLFQELGAKFDLNERIEPPKFKERTSSSDSLNSSVESNTPIFSIVYKGFLEKKISAGLSVSMQSEYQRFFSAWQATMEDKSIGEYGRKEIEVFLETVSRLPRRNLKAYRDIPIHELFKVEYPKKDLISAKTVLQYKRWIQGVFAYARDEDLIKTSPVNKVKGDFNKSTTTYGAYSDFEIRKLLEVSAGNGKEWQKWLVLLGAYTGMRLGEIHALHSDAVKYDEDSKSHYIVVTDSYGGKLKTEAAKRTIPLHTQLLDAGFLEWTQSKNGALFTIARSTVTQWFTGKLMSKAEVAREDDYGNRRVFHSLRHTFVTKARGKGVEAGLVQQVVGHETSGAGITERYTHRHQIRDLKAVVNAIDYSAEAC